jgi:hypothetical protein
VRTEDQIQADAAAERAFSNGTEYEIWAGRHCYECLHDNPETGTFCPILTVALLGHWPVEWTRATHNWTVGEHSGSYEVVDTCTEFERRPDDGPGDDPPPDRPGPWDPEMPGQVDMFGVFVEQGINDLDRQAVPA